ncbi:unnamed protein product, partial [Onchocerca ochengi]|uniref:WH2 domain-containing protein n=1 Tax=Onchocerca ochengi TaxID=42157 RepID=A0A182EZQ7_ONCOC
PRVSVSPVPSLRSPPAVSSTTETSTKSGIVSALTQKFEMNSGKQVIDESTSSVDGNKWSPKFIRIK